MEPEKLVLETLWDKTFPKSDWGEHKKITFVNRYGITLAADQYTPRDRKGKLAALAVSGPFGAIKEQCSGFGSGSDHYSYCILCRMAQGLGGISHGQRSLE